MNKKPTYFDALLLCGFVIFITLQPFYLHHEIIMMETGIHLPALNALFHGGIPYRDFYFLRGPLELYVPALMMLMAGKNTALLPLFYYGGTVWTLVFCVFIGQQLFRTRFIFYLMIPVLVARTFPRVSYYYWGGIRYAIGFLAILFLIYFFKKQRPRWLFLGGIISAFALLTTVETGICSIAATVVTYLFALTFQPEKRSLLGKSFWWYILGLLLILGSYVLYLLLTGSLVPFLEATFVVLTKMTATFIDAKGNHPESFLEFLSSLLPGSRYFKFMTPVYCYAVFLFSLFVGIKKKRINVDVVCSVSLAVYGIILYMAAFRKIEGHHFEMSLQPEKFLLFFMFEQAWFFLKDKRAQIPSQQILAAVKARTFSLREAKAVGINLVLFFFAIGSLGYAIQRYDHRFAMFKWIKKNIFHQEVKGLSLLENIETETLHLKRLEGSVVPRWQAQEIKGVVEFIETYTAPKEAVFTYPELGNYNFWADRPFVGRFPIATFSWMSESWHEELLADFKKSKPRYVIMTKLADRTFPHEWYFRNPKNSERYHLLTHLILDNYDLVRSFSSVSIYRRKPQGANPGNESR